MRVLVLLVVLVLPACSAKAPDYTREEWMRGSTAVFPGVSRERFLAAVEKLFRLADRDDVRFIRSPEGMKATRWVLSFPSNVYYVWDIACTETDAGVTADVGISVTDYKFGTVSAPRQEHSLSVIDLFFGRVAYLLGQEKTWKSCADYEAAHPGASSLDALCSSADDERP